MEGLASERPFHALGMWIFMLSFAGFPLTGGFIGKFYVFSATYQAGWWWLVVIGVIATAVSLGYYLAVIRAMYMRPSQVTGTVVAVGGSGRKDPGLDATVLVAIAVVIGSFFFAQPLIDVVREATTSLLF